MNEGSVESCHKLASILDKISSVQKPLNAAYEQNDTNLNIGNPTGWYEFFDQNSGKSYFHNYSLNITQWDRPKELEHHKENITKPAEDFKVVGYFGKSTGKFTSSTYWEKVGRESDKAGRQLGVFMDLSELEQNREEAKRMKEQARKRSGTTAGINWTKHKEEKQKEKKKKTQSWLYEP